MRGIMFTPCSSPQSHEARAGLFPFLLKQKTHFAQQQKVDFNRLQVKAATSTTVNNSQQQQGGKKENSLDSLIKSLNFVSRLC